ncbi:hypothetical protein U9M48_018928 [Paspalum notatum var. saurae]|uniref:Uncharacterized protein n=1 Tax=Paspalum notatum var. saurae TaxID=547442 RepID=A0AAQ3TB74_PASNO
MNRLFPATDLRSRKKDEDSNSPYPNTDAGLQSDMIQESVQMLWSQPNMPGLFGDHRQTQYMCLRLRLQLMR